ncbi:MAG: hypothetical protein LBV04_07360 [Deferribacteraceae bacterium]|jgi:CRP-like cAMP-binding protein|nr:hypothetical protein [Deferribacteraceae bacterium]
MKANKVNESNLHEFRNDLPFLGPTIPDDLRIAFNHFGKQCFAPKKSMLFPLYEKNVIYVKSGMVGGYLINNNLSKPNNMRLITPMRVYGGQFFLDDRYLANKLFAITDTEYVMISVDKLKYLIDDNLKYYKKCVLLFCAYETRDVERYYILLTSKAEHRLRLLMYSLALSTPQEAKLAGWYLLPEGITREYYSNIIYTTVNTIDTIFQKWKEEGMYKRNDKKSYIHEKLIENIYHDGKDLTEKLYNPGWH